MSTEREQLDVIEMGDRVETERIVTAVYGPMTDEDYAEAVEERRTEYLGTALGCPATIDPWEGA